MNKQIHVKEYTRKRHGRAKFGGKVSSHNKSGRATRGLVSLQKKLIKKAVDNAVSSPWRREVRHIHLPDEDNTLMKELERINDYDTLWVDANRYANDLLSKHRFGKSGRAMDDESIFKKYKAAYNLIPGPRVGDYLEYDGRKTRITYIWRDENNVPLQYQDGGHAFGQFHLGNGYISYSGSLDSGVSTDTHTLKDTGRKEEGGVWFFKGGHAGAGRGIDKTMMFRVFEAVKK